MFSEVVKIHPSDLTLAPSPLAGNLSCNLPPRSIAKVSLLGSRKNNTSYEMPLYCAAVLKIYIYTHHSVDIFNFFQKVSDWRAATVNHYWIEELVQTKGESMLNAKLQNRTYNITKHVW